MADPLGERGRFEQGLGRDAAAVEARAADLVLVDEGDLQPELGGAEGGGIAACAGAEDDEIEVVGGADGQVSEPEGTRRADRRDGTGTREAPACAWAIAASSRGSSRRRRPRILAAGASSFPVLPLEPLATDLAASDAMDPRSCSRPGGPRAASPTSRARSRWACSSRALVGGPDPRTIGSGRTGGTNALRALGRKWAAVVVAGDLLKGAVPVLWHASSPAIRWSRCCAASRPSPARSGRSSPASAAAAASGTGSGRCS